MFESMRTKFINLEVKLKYISFQFLTKKLFSVVNNKIQRRKLS